MKIYQSILVLAMAAAQTVSAELSVRIDGKSPFPSQTGGGFTAIAYRMPSKTLVPPDRCSYAWSRTGGSASYFTLGNIYGQTVSVTLKGGASISSAVQTSLHCNVTAKFPTDSGKGTRSVTMRP